MSITPTQDTLPPEKLTLQYSGVITPYARFFCLQRFIIQSEKRPLDLEIDAQGVSLAMFGDDEKKAHRLIQGNLNRFRKLVLKYSRFSLPPACKTSSLEILEVDNAIPIERFPKAKHLRFAKVCLIQTPGTCFSDYPRLETLEMYADTLPGAPSVIPQGVPRRAIRRITIRQNEDDTHIGGEVPSAIFHLPRGACIKFECASGRALTAIFRAVRVVDPGMRLVIEDCAYRQPDDGQPACVVEFRGSIPILSAAISSQGSMQWNCSASASPRLLIEDGPDSQRDSTTLVQPIASPNKQSINSPIHLRLIYTAGSLGGGYEAEQPSPATDGDEQTTPNGSTCTVPI